MAEDINKNTPVDELNVDNVDEKVGPDLTNEDIPQDDGFKQVEPATDNAIEHYHGFADVDDDDSVPVQVADGSLNDFGR